LIKANVIVSSILNLFIFNKNIIIIRINNYYSDNDMMTDYINSNYVVEVENKPYSRPSFLGLTAEETQVFQYSCRN